jgi:hypothetical protein
MGKARKHTDQFSQGEDLDLDAIIYLIGVQIRSNSSRI